MLIQWGEQADSPQIVEVTLPLAYSNTNFSVVATDVAGSPGGVEYISIGVNSYGKTTTTFYIIGNLNPRNSMSYWHTIGY